MQRCFAPARFIPTLPSMKRLLLAFLITTTAGFAESSFPGISSIMTLQEFHDAGLDKLSPDQLKTLDKAIVRHYAGAVKTAAGKQATQLADKAFALKEERSLLQRFGLPDISFSDDWRSKPALTGTFVRWVGGNSFQLDNGQIWKGVEPIRYELKNRDISTAHRPHGQFALIVDGKNTTIRIIRVK